MWMSWTKLKPVFRSTARIELSGDMAELQEWNELFKRLNDLAHPQQQKFFAALEVTGAEELGQMQLLVSALDDFDLTPNIADAESYGKHMIQESGKYDYVELQFAGQIVRIAATNKSVSTGVAITKTGYKEVMPGQVERFTFTDIGNTSTVPLQDFYWRDTISTDALRLNQVVTGTWNVSSNYTGV